jgi:hypothetical protein
MASESKRIDFDFDKPKTPPTDHFWNGINGEQPPPSSGPSKYQTARQDLGALERAQGGRPKGVGNGG